VASHLNRIDLPNKTSHEYNIKRAYEMSSIKDSPFTVIHKYT